MLRQPQSYVHIATLIRTLASDSTVSVSFTNHARQRMKERGIEYSDVLYVLKRCVVTDERLEKGEWIHNAEGKNADGVPMSFAVVEYKSENRLKIVSAWKL